MQDPVRPSALRLDGNAPAASNSSASTAAASEAGSSPMITPTRSSGTDLPNTVGNTSRRDNGALMYREVQENQEQSPEDFQQHHLQQRRQWWDSNYKEAAIFLEVRLFLSDKIQK